MSGGIKVAREIISVALAGYGQFSSSGVNHSRARVWVLAEPTSNFGEVRVAHNGPDGRPVWNDIGRVTAVTASKHRWVLTFEDGTKGVLALAPCVCGAGAVGHAGPSGGPHSVGMVRADQLPWVTVG